MTRTTHSLHAALLAGAALMLIAGDAGAAADEARLDAFEGLWLSGPGGARGGPPSGGGRFAPPDGANFGPGGPGFGPQGFTPTFGGAPGGFRPAGGPGGRPFGPPEGVADSDLPAALGGQTGLDRGDLRIWSEMTAEGRAAFAAQDPHDLPANNCQSAGLPHIAGAPGLQEWRVEDGVLTIRHEFSSAVRTIDLADTAHPDAAHTPDGHAIAWFEGDTLVIETANLAATPGGLARNAPASDSRTVVEKYRVTPDGGLRGDMTISDPAYLTRPITLPLGYRAAEAGTTLEFFPCSVEAAQRHLES